MGALEQIKSFYGLKVENNKTRFENVDKFLKRSFATALFIIGLIGAVVAGLLAGQLIAQGKTAIIGGVGTAVGSLGFIVLGIILILGSKNYSTR